MDSAITLQTASDDHGRRLDRIVRKALPALPLSLIHRLLRQGKILVDGKSAKPDQRIQAGAVLTIPGAHPPVRKEQSNDTELTKSTQLEIISQKNGLLILNKPPGIAVHGPGSLDTLVRRYLSTTASDENASISFRPGPLHRLDKPTSGLIVFSTSLAGAQSFSELLREGKVKKYYLAIVEGHLEKDQLWEDDLSRDRELKKTFVSEGGQNAVTRVSPLAVSEGGYSLIQAEIATGRTHQIRAQAAAHGHPLAGDVKYGGRVLAYTNKRLYLKRGGNFYLHAWKLEMPDEIFSDYTLVAPPPEAFLHQVKTLFGKDFSGLG